jgi:hypothetical protein
MIVEDAINLIFRFVRAEEKIMWQANNRQGKIGKSALAEERRAGMKLLRALAPEATDSDLEVLLRRFS